MKRNNLILTAMLAIALCFTACSSNDDKISVESISLNKTELVLEVGKSEELTATITPNNATGTVKWSSTNNSVATVNNSGKVTALAEGATTIKASVDGKNATCIVTVLKLVETVNGATFEMVVVEGGTFTMGGTSEQGSDVISNERPTHSVTLSNDFLIGKHEVTQGLWKAVMGSYPGTEPSSTYGLGDNYPVYNVNYNDIHYFIIKLNELTGETYRLPTEAEWEYAARGGKKSQGYKYSGSNTAADVAWYIENSGGISHPVGTKQANELGIYDMSGNVWEWCYDYLSNYSPDAQTNPTGTSSGTNRVLRGAGWGSIVRYVRVSCRGDSTPDDRHNGNVGFRLARSL